MISTHNVLRKLSIDAVLNPAIEIRGEKAKSILSYAVAGVVAHKATRQRIMMENAVDARNQAVQEYHRQFNIMFLRNLGPFLRQKYDMTPFKKALLETGNREIHYMREGRRNQDIEQFLTIIRSTIREKENKKHTESGKIEHQYQLTNLVSRVYQTLQALIRSGTENLNRFTGKSLHEIADILGVFPIPLTAAQKSVLHQLDNPHFQYPPKKTVHSQEPSNTVSLLPKGSDLAAVTIADLGVEQNAQYTFVLDQNVTYKMEGNDITMPPGTKLTGAIYAFHSNNGNPYLVVIPNRAQAPSGFQFQFPMTNQEFRLFVTPGLKIVRQTSPRTFEAPQEEEKSEGKWRKPKKVMMRGRDYEPRQGNGGDIADILPQYKPSSEASTGHVIKNQPNMGLFNIFTGASHNDDRDIKYIAGMENADAGVSIIPFWLQIRHAHDYNQRQYSEKMNQSQICNAFATCVLQEKGFPYETIEQKEEFRRQKNEFCDTLTESIQTQIQQLWEKRGAPFSRLTKEEMQAVENTFYKPLSMTVDNKASPQQIVDWFRQNNRKPSNIISLKDIQNNEEGTIIIEDADVDNVHSCKYVYDGRSAEYLTVKSMVTDIWAKMKIIKIRELLRDGMGESDARAAMLKFFQTTFQFIDKIEDAQKLYEEYSNIVTQKRVRSALTNIYDTANKQYKTLQRLLVTITDPDQIAGKDAFFQLFSPDFRLHRDTLILSSVQPFSVDELIKMTPVRIPFSPSAADLVWLKSQFTDVLMALNCFLKYAQKKGDSSHAVEIRHTKFVVNMYAKCFDHISDEMSMSVDDEDTPDMPKDFKELVFFEMGNDSLRYVWAYMISLYNARVLLRRKLAARGLKMESTETIDRISSKFADEFTEKLDGAMFGGASLPDKRFFHLTALAFSSIIFNLRQYWKTNRSRVSRQTFGQPEIDFAYHILSRQEASNVPSTVENNAVKNLVERLAESWPNADDIQSEISSRLYDLMMDLYNNQNRFMASIKSRLYYFATISIVEAKDEAKDDVKEDMHEEENGRGDESDREQEDDDQPEDGEDYEEEEDDLFEDDENDLFGDDE